MVLYGFNNEILDYDYFNLYICTGINLTEMTPYKKNKKAFTRI